MSNFKPFTLEPIQKNRPWNQHGSARVKHKPYTLPESRGVSMLPRTGGAAHMRHLYVATEPEKLQRKQMTASQINAARVKFLDDKGWGCARISNFLGVKPSWVQAVIYLRIHRYVAAQRPSNYTEPTA